MTRFTRFCAAALMLMAIYTLQAAEHSPTLDNLIAVTPKGEPIPVILFLDFRLTMDEVYPVARTLPMKERREYVIEVLQRRFDEMSPRVMERLELAQKEGQVTLLRPLWILNAIRVSATAEILDEIDRQFSEVIYIAHDAVYDDVLDWGNFEIGAPRVWSELGVDGSGVVVGHKDSGVDWDHPGFVGHIWINPGEDLNGDGNIDGDEINDVDDDGNGYVDDFRGWNFDYNNNNVMDDNSHGTKTGSVITSNHTPCDTISVAPGAKLMVLLGYGAQGSGWESSQYAVLMGANVISQSYSYKQTNCDHPGWRDCPNYVAHRWVSEMELAAGLIHANSTGNEAAANPVPFSAATPSNCPPPAMTPSHEQQGGVSSIVAVAAYFQGGVYYTGSGHGPSAWSREDICVHPRMPFCGLAGSPTSYPGEFEDYPYHNAEFPGLAKPDITAPTVVPSLSWGGGCASINGTSGATPHVGGALALIYSAFPGITPEDAYLVLVNGAEDAGVVGFDSLWGFGKLRIFRACSTGFQMRGTVRGHVDDPLDNPVPGVRVSTDGIQPVFTNATGDYELSVEPGAYTLLFEKWSYADTTAEVILSAGEIDTQDVFMLPALAAVAHGAVTHNGEPLAGVEILIPEGDVSVTTDDFGQYIIPNLFAGTYEVIVGDLPWETVTTEIVAQAGDNIFDFALTRSPRTLPTGPDAYGYLIYDNYDAEALTYNWVEVVPSQGGNGTVLGISDNSSTVLTLPFSVTFYGQQYNQITVADNGFVILGSSSSGEFGPYPIPRVEPPNGFVAPYYTDWIPNQGGTIAYLSDAANHRVIVEWYNVIDYWGAVRASFEVIISEPGFPPTPSNDSQIIFQYKRLWGRFEGVVGIENQSGTDGIQYEFQTMQDPHAVPIDSGTVLVISTDTTLIADESGMALPREFSLEPNFPNPFNPTTTFVWNVPRAADIRVALYDVLGREAAVVFEGRSAAGRFETTFDASGLTTGVYFARLESGGQSFGTRKVLLLK